MSAVFKSQEQTNGNDVKGLREEMELLKAMLQAAQKENETLRDANAKQADRIERFKTMLWQAKDLVSDGVIEGVTSSEEEEPEEEPAEEPEPEQDGNAADEANQDALGDQAEDESIIAAENAISCLSFPVAVNEECQYAKILSNGTLFRSVTIPTKNGADRYAYNFGESKLQWYDLTSNSLQREVAVGSSRVLSYLQDTGSLWITFQQLAQGEGAEFKVWDVYTGEVLQGLSEVLNARDIAKEYSQFFFSGTELYIVNNMADNGPCSVDVVDTRENFYTQHITLPEDLNRPKLRAVTADQRCVLTNSTTYRMDDRDIHESYLWNRKEGRLLKFEDTLMGHEPRFIILKDWLIGYACGGYARTNVIKVKVWAPQGACVHTLDIDHLTDTQLQGLGNSHIVSIAGGEDRNVVKIWDVAQGICVREIETKVGETVLGVFVVPDGQLFISYADSVESYDVSEYSLAAEQEERKQAGESESLADPRSDALEDRMGRVVQLLESVQQLDDGGLSAGNAPQSALALLVQATQASEDRNRMGRVVQFVQQLEDGGLSAGIAPQPALVQVAQAGAAAAQIPVQAASAEAHVGQPQEDDPVALQKLGFGN